MGEKEASIVNLAKSLSGLPFQSKDFDVNNKFSYFFLKFYKVNPTYPYYNSFPQSLVKNGINHKIWGINQIKDLYCYDFPIINIKIVYLCFSVINRPSFKMVAKVKIWQNIVLIHFRN